METRAHQVVLLCSNYCCTDLGKLASYDCQDSWKGGNKAIHSLSISREAAQRLLRSVPPASLQRRCLVHLFWSHHDLCNESRGQARSTKVKRTNRHFAAKVKAKKFASASTGQVRRLRTCTMMYAIQRVVRVITRSTTLRLPRNNSSQEPWKRCAVLFCWGGGGGGRWCRDENAQV